MAVDDYNDAHHMRNDVRDAHTNSSVARVLATLALIGTVLAMAVSIAAWNKANDAWGNSQRAIESIQSTRQ